MTRLFRTFVGSLTALALTVVGSVALLAQGEQTFVPIAEQPQQTISASPLILGAYGFVWAAVFLYVFLMWQRLKKVEHELADVNARLAKRATAR